MNLCNDVITVFNAKLDADTGNDVYHATTITGVSWFCEIASNVDNSGLKAANKFTIRIPETADFSEKAFVDPQTYAASVDVRGVFTLQNGDIIVRGSVIEENPRPAALHKKYEAFTVLGVTDNRHA